jgi:tetratricopeptide (TPR) repeat protein
MAFFDKLFGKKKPESVSPPSKVASATTEQVKVPPAMTAEEIVSPAKPDPASDPNLIKVFDEYGREMFVTREQWRDNVLLGNLEKHREEPDALYSILVRALDDGFAADVVSHAEHLREIDADPSRGATLLAIIYMETGRLDEAQQVLEEQLARHGEDGVLFTNLARVYSLRNDNARAESTLWHALELDPNQNTALGWYAAMQHERDGEAGELAAYRKVAALPGSWRARLFLARAALQQKDLAAAEALYQEALALAGEPVPSDLLMQMSGDLGTTGFFVEIVRLAAPHFDPRYHAIEVGNNLLRANLEMGRLAEAHILLKQLYDQKRPDWKQTLIFWETEIAKAETAKKAQEPGKPLAIAMVSIDGPLWMRDGAPFASLLEPKKERAPRIAVFGSTALMEKGPEKPALHLSDAAGRLSRSIPLMLAELVHLTTDAVGSALIPWAQGKGFALFGDTNPDSALCQIAGKGEDAPDYIIGVTIDATQPVWSVNLRLVRGVLGIKVAESSIQVDLEDLGAFIEGLSKLLDNMLTSQTGVSLTSPPAWYQLPAGYGGADYLLRLEQLLTVACNNLDFLEGGALFGEREILDGAIQLCANQPRNPTARMLYAQSLRMMKKAHPEIVSEYREKTAHLQRDYPIADKEVTVLLEKAIDEAFA